MDNSVRILLVEDDQVDVESIKRAFKEYKVIIPLYVASNGLEALDMLRGTHGQKKISPSLVVLLDLNMPKMNGIEFLKIIRQDEKLKSLIVFILTTSHDEHDIAAAYGLNVAGYIVKPLQFVDFLEKFKSLSLYLDIIEMPHE